METIAFVRLKTSRFILGSNPFSGFSHQGVERDNLMRHYFKTEVIKATLRAAESQGITTVLARTDHHVMRFLMEYWDEGGRMQWFAQTCPEVGSHEACIERAAQGGAVACHIHGGVMDSLLASKRLSEVQPAVNLIRSKGMLAGIAGHDPRVFDWAEQNLDVDYYMCSYYNPISRPASGEHVSGSEEVYRDENRRAMIARIRTLSRPVIHYKILAAGRNDPREAFRTAASAMRDSDAVCVGVFPKDNPRMIWEDLAIFEQAWRQSRAGGRTGRCEA